MAEERAGQRGSRAQGWGQGRAGWGPALLLAGLAAGRGWRTVR